MVQFAVMTQFLFPMNKNKIKFLTLYAFSTENWKRSQKEILFLLALLEKFLDDLESKIEDFT